MIKDMPYYYCQNNIDYTMPTRTVIKLKQCNKFLFITIEMTDPTLNAMKVTSIILVMGAFLKNSFFLSSKMKS
jgi:hypothetical protein